MAEYSSLVFSFRDAKRHLAPYASPVGVLLNAILLYLIIAKSTATMISFKKVILLTCISEMTFSAVNFVFILTVMVQETTYFVVVDGILGHLSPFWTHVGLFFFATMLYASVYNTTMVFFYRYLSVCRSKTLSTWMFVLCVASGWTNIFLYIGVILFNCVAPSEDPKVDEKLTAGGFPSSNGSFRDYMSCELEKFSRYSMYGAIPFTTFAYGSVIAMSFAVQRSFKNLRSLLSLEQQRFHGEVTVILWVEALTPFITVVLPIYYDISKLFIPHMPFEWFAEFAWLLTLIGPSFTAIVKMVSIKAFRETILLKVKKVCNKSTSEVGLANQPTVSSSITARNANFNHQ